MNDMYQSLDFCFVPDPDQEACPHLNKVPICVFWVAGHVGSASSSEMAGLV